MKGAGTTLASIIIIIILLFFLAIYLNTINNELNKRVTLNLREADILKLGNTFVLTNRSLGMTWFISSVQAMFNATDESFFCGADDENQETANDPDFLPAGYVYRYDGVSFKNENGVWQLGQQADQPTTLDVARQNKYNKNYDWPRVCYVSDLDARQILVEQFEPYTKIKDSFKANGIDVNVEDITTEFKFPSANGIVLSNTKQKLTLTTGSGLAKIKTETENPNTFYTELSDMVEGLRRIVRYLTSFSDELYATTDEISNPSGLVFNDKLRYQPLVSALPDMRETYIDRIESTMNSGVAVKLATAPGTASLPPLISNLFGSRRTTGFQGSTSLKFDSKEIFAANQEDSQIFGKDKASVADKGSYGLVLHYDATIRLTDSTSVAGGLKGSNNPNYIVYKTLIEAYVATKDWSFDDEEYTNQEITAFMSAIVQTESSWDTRKVGNCGEAGLNQFMPGTAKEQFKSPVNIFQDAGFSGCGDDVKAERLEYAYMLKDAINGKDNEAIKAVDDRFAPEKSISASINFVHDLFEQMNGYTKSKDELLYLVTAAYNTGRGNVENAIAKAVELNPEVDKTNVRFEQIRGYLLAGTQNYVPRVMGFYLYYGGTLTPTGLYYYHDPEKNTFTPKPFSIAVKAEDYLPALNCINESLPGTPAYMYAYPFFTLGGEKIDMACCGGSLWSCNQEIDKLSDKQSLVTGDFANRDRGFNYEPSQNCDRALNPTDPSSTPQIPIQLWDLACTADFGFVRVPRTGPVTCEADQYVSNNVCRDCPVVSSCRDFGRDHDACSQCKTASGQSCKPGFLGLSCKTGPSAPLPPPTILSSVTTCNVCISGNNIWCSQFNDGTGKGMCVQRDTRPVSNHCNVYTDTPVANIVCPS
jgi:hypothetical protein